MLAGRTCDDRLHDLRSGRNGNARSVWDACDGVCSCASFENEGPERSQLTIHSNRCRFLLRLSSGFGFLGNYMQAFEIKKLSVGTVFKLVGVGLLFSFVPFTILMGCMAALGMDTLFWNNQPLHGWVAIVSAPFIGLFLTAAFTLLIGSAATFGLWVYSLLGSISIAYKPADASGQEP